MSDSQLIHGDALKPPFPWFGGKSRAAGLIWDRLGDVDNYVEPFAGSLAVLLNRPHEPRTETVNDADRFLSNFWRAVQADPEGVAAHADWPVNECIPAGTMIATPSGHVPVEMVTEGMTVWGCTGSAVVPTTVIATKQSSTADPFYRIGNLRLTGNHPVWTKEAGYIESSRLAVGMTVRKLVESEYGTTLDHIHTCRSPHGGDPLCGGDPPSSPALQRTSVQSQQGRQDAPGLLDSVLVGSGASAGPDDHSGGGWCGLAGCRARMDRQASGDNSASQPHRRGRRYARIRTAEGAAGQVVQAASWREICRGASVGYEGADPYTGSPREDSSRQHREIPHGCIQGEAIGGPHGQATYERAPAVTFGAAQREGLVRWTQGEDCCIHNRAEGRPLRRDSDCLPIDHGCGERACSDRGVHQSGDPEGLSLSRESSPVRVARTVYNFQTATGNYFAAGVLVHNCDLEARHFWLISEGQARLASIMATPDGYDAQIAGWWVWGQCAWIGGGWCSGEGPWRVEGGQWANLRNAGQGVNRQLPHLRNAGQGVNRKLPHLGDAGKGVNRQLPHLGNAGKAHPHREHLIGYMQALAARLRYVRVCCGDWRRVLTPSVTFRHGTTGIVLDPPYGTGEMDYSAGGNRSDIAADVRAWAIEAGDNPGLRIALCGYEGQFDMPGAWTCVAWKAAGGYSSTAAQDTQGKANRHRERVWFSPHCVRVERQIEQADLFKEAV